MMARDRHGEVRALYRLLSTEQLLVLRRAFEWDRFELEEHRDDVGVAFCDGRIELIDRELLARNTALPI